MQEIDPHMPRRYFVPLRPENAARFHRENVVIISVLIFLVIGVLISAISPQTTGSAMAAGKTTTKAAKKHNL